MRKLLQTRALLAGVLGSLAMTQLRAKPQLSQSINRSDVATPPSAADKVTDFQPPIGRVTARVSCPPGWDVVGPNCQTEIVIPPKPACIKGVYNAELGTCTISDEQPAPLLCPRLCRLVDKAFEQDGQLTSPLSEPVSGTRNPVCACQGVIAVDKICPLGYELQSTSQCRVNAASSHPPSPNSPEEVPAICPEGTQVLYGEEGCFEVKELRPKSVCPKGYIFQTKLVNDYAFHGRSFLYCLKSFDFIPKLSCPPDFSPLNFPDFGNLLPGDPVPEAGDSFEGTSPSAWERQAREQLRERPDGQAGRERNVTDAVPEQIPNNEQFIDEVVQPSEDAATGAADEVGEEEFELRAVSLDPSGRLGGPGQISSSTGPSQPLTRPQLTFSPNGAEALRSKGPTGSRRKSQSSRSRRLQATPEFDAYAPPTCNLMLSVPSNYCSELGKCRGMYITSLKKRLNDIADDLGVEVDDLVPGGL